MRFVFQSWEAKLIDTAMFYLKKGQENPTDTSQADYTHKYKTRKGIPEERDQPGQPET